MKTTKQKHQLDLNYISLQSFKNFYISKSRTNSILSPLKATYNNENKFQATSLIAFNNNPITGHKLTSYYIYNPNSFPDLSISTRKQWCPIQIDSLTRYI